MCVCISTSEHYQVATLLHHSETETQSRTQPQAKADPSCKPLLLATQILPRYHLWSFNGTGCVLSVDYTISV